MSAILAGLYCGKDAVQEALSARVCVAGQVMEGDVMSVRVTLNEQVAVLPLPSLAVRVTVVLPTPETVLPDAGV